MCTNYNLDLYFAYQTIISNYLFLQICQSQNVNIASFKGQLIQKFGHFSIFFFSQNFEILISCLLAAQQAKILKKSAIQGNHTHFTIKKARIMEPIALIFFIQPTVSLLDTFKMSFVFSRNIHNNFLHNNVVKPGVKSLFYLLHSM